MQGDTLKDIDIEALNAEFEAAHPGVTVDLQEQTWGEYTTKVTTGLADTSDSAPDVLELGNTQVAQFAGAGALMELDKADFENSDTWLGGLEESSTYDGKLIAVPYYAGVRVGIYRTDLAEPPASKPPFNSLDDMQAAGVKLLNAHGDDGRSPACTSRASTGTRVSRSSGTRAARSPPRPPTAPGPARWTRRGPRRACSG